MNLGLLVALENANKVYPRFLTLDHMGTPLKNQNFENRASTCLKLAQIRPRAIIWWPCDFWWLRKMRTNPQDSCFISIDMTTKSYRPIGRKQIWSDICIYSTSDSYRIPQNTCNFIFHMIILTCLHILKIILHNMTIWSVVMSSCNRQYAFHNAHLIWNSECRYLIAFWRVQHVIFPNSMCLRKLSNF